MARGSRSRNPDKLTLKSYQVGFGDCFLLTFHYDQQPKHILIDFGSTRYPEGAPQRFLKKVAQQIKEDCSGDLLAVVATHRHRDHIRGFEGNSQKNGPGDIIEQCKPEVVIQPWTEDPDAPRNFSGPRMGRRDDVHAFVEGLNSMNSFARSALREVGHLFPSTTAAAASELAFIGQDNIKNKNAVEKLIAMGQGGRARYVYHGGKSGLEGKLPGVKIHVLGPPTLRQSDEIRHQAHRHDEEFWHFQAGFWQLQARAARKTGKSDAPPFPEAELATDPADARWFKLRMKNLRADHLLRIVRILDESMNNTSVILLFEIGDKAILFPGDAQIENWTYALSREENEKLLAKVQIYKVGHHGSLNATPKSLWKLFEKRGRKGSPERLKTVLSTLKGVHGKSERNTEVPRRTLVKALKKDSDYLSTEDIPIREMGRTIELDLT
jgi:hypothetical protein